MDVNPKLKWVAGTVAAVVTIVTGYNTLEISRYRPLMAYEVDEKIAAESGLLWAELKARQARNDRLLLKEARDQIYIFWVAKCAGDAAETVDTDMDVYYDEFLRIQMRDHNWRDNNLADEEEVFTILRRRGDC